MAEFRGWLSRQLVPGPVHQIPVTLEGPLGEDGERLARTLDQLLAPFLGQHVTITITPTDAEQQGSAPESDTEYSRDRRRWD